MVLIKILNMENIKELLDIRETINLVEEAYILKQHKDTTLFSAHFHEFEKVKLDMNVNSGYIKDEGVLGLKLVSWFAENYSEGIQSVFDTLLLLDSTTGKPLCLLNGRDIALMRTGAASAIGSKYLARNQSENLLLIGCGDLGYYHVLSHLIIMKNIKKITVYNPNSVNKAMQFCLSLKEKLNELLIPLKYEKSYFKELKTRIKELILVATEDIEGATGVADIILTITPSKKPLLQAEWVNKGTHISCIGSEMVGKQGLDELIFIGSRVFVDNLNQAVNVGEVEIPLKKGVIKKEDIVGEIGSVILNKIPGRLSDNDITIFDSTGIALPDLITAKYLYTKSEKSGIGAKVLI